MKSLTAIRLPTLIFLLSTTLLGQGSIDFQRDFSEGFCPYDTTQTGFYPESYAFFVTRDDTYSGVIDSSWCPVFRFSENTRPKYRLDLRDFDFNRKLFARISFPDSMGLPLFAYRDYVLDLDLWSNGIALNPDSVCSQRVLKYAAITDNGDTIRRSFSFDMLGQYPENDPAICFFSERFARQWITELGLELCLERETANAWLTTFGFGVYYDGWPFGPAEVASMTFPTFSLRDSIYVSNLPNIVSVAEGQTNFSGAYFLPQYSDRTPGPRDIRFMDVDVEGGSDTVVSMRIEQDLFSYLLFPPFTAIRGAPARGEEAQRHRLTLAFPDGSFPTCVAILVERPAPPNTVFEFGNDTLRFGGREGCFYFDRGAGMHLRPDVNFCYGMAGVGMLAMEPESQLKIGAGAVLEIGNTLRILNRDDHARARIYLNEGSLLRFTEGARAELKFSDAAGWIEVFNNGGRVDFGPLSAVERSLFRFVRPEGEPEFRAGELLSFPNPIFAGQQLHVPLPSGPETVALNFQLFDSEGRELQSGTQPGGPVLSLNLPVDLPTGVYLLRIKAGQRHYRSRILVR